MSSKIDQMQAWLESVNGERWPVVLNSAMGRAPTNQIVLSETKVSRQHAIIHSQGAHEYWLVDLGSSNGTYLNGRRVAQPTRLQDRDQIGIGDSLLTFRRQHAPAATSNGTADATISEIKHGNCWLLLADIIDSTQISRKLPPQELAMTLGQWLGASKELIERNQGTINKFLGDGFFAYWSATTPVERIVRALSELRQAQDRGQPVFRVALHYGEVAMGGASLGEESLIGASVNTLFRMEKLAGALGEPRMMSETAWALLRNSMPATPLGEHELQGFAGQRPYFSF